MLSDGAARSSLEHLKIGSYDHRTRKLRANNQNPIFVCAPLVGQWRDCSRPRAEPAPRSWTLSSAPAMAGWRVGRCSAPRLSSATTDYSARACGRSSSRRYFTAVQQARGIRHQVRRPRQLYFVVPERLASFRFSSTARAICRTAACRAAGLKPHRPVHPQCSSHVRSAGRIQRRTMRLTGPRNAK
jgi:hypothetical protein